MSSPSPGKRRMDTDVVKLYPSENVNNTTESPSSLVFRKLSAHGDACFFLLLSAGSVQPLGWRLGDRSGVCSKYLPANTRCESAL